MNDLGAAKQILGLRIIRNKANGTLKLSQIESVKKIIGRFNMDRAKPVITSLESQPRINHQRQIRRRHT
jgi:hypothetical protein